ncbi:MAG TPA: RNA polymerase sigma factor [Rhodobacteraceae bacterium]|jgi:RNA polymerase sigma-70 factor (ECF subfamily)|nr:RNA polymerase sigma factor [Paracoccaceae bacterium]
MKMPFDTISDTPDEALLVLYANGDKAAAQALMMRLTPRVLGYAARLLSDHSEAEDVAQEAMLRLWKIAPDWRQGEAKVSTWLYRVVSNLCTDRLRKKRGVALDLVAEPEDGKPSATQTMIEAQRATALQNALNQLPQRQRSAVVLRHLQGATNPQIAEILEISVEAVESLTARGKRALTAILANKQDELGYSDDG